MKNSTRVSRSVLWVCLSLSLLFLACGEEKTTEFVPVPTPPVTTGGMQVVVQQGTTPIAGATVVLTPGGQSQTTDTQGSVTFTDLAVGLYSVQVTATGYNEVTRQNILVVAGSTIDVMFSMMAVGAAPAKVIQVDDRIQLAAADFQITAPGLTLSGWASTQPPVAFVNDTGLVTGLGKGVARISAIRSDNNEQVSLKVAVLLPLLQKGTVNPGDPVISAAAGYVGASVCNNCHPDKFTTWKDTVHNMMVRGVNQPGNTGQAIVADADDNGINDFVQGLDLGTSPNATPFAVYGQNAPKLGYTDEGDYTITIGPVTYQVIYTVGGNGYWNQRYLLRVADSSDSSYLSPVQYNEATKKYVVYAGGNWYDASNQPRFQDPATVLQNIDKTTSWERRCSGCHVVGSRVNVNAGTGEWRAGYAQLSVGCESCHGPGGAHPAAALAGEADLRIVNPAELTLAQANDVCGACHIRGNSIASLAGQTLGFPATVQGANAIGFMPGTNVADVFNVTADTADYWGYDGIWRGAHGSSIPPYQTFVASRSHRQQSIDYVESLHGQGNNAITCFECHDAHGSGQTWDIVAEKTESDCVGPFCQSECPNPQQNVTMQTQNDDNTLCLSCHSNWGPFRTLCKSDVNNDPAKVADVVIQHMSVEALMAVPYQPVATGLGRCSACHMPMMAKSAVTTPDADGKTLGDVHTHTFEIVWPSVDAFIDPNMPNSCTLCHSHFDPTEGNQKIFQWAKSGHADVRQMHWRYSTGPDRQDCVRCHSGSAFVEFLAGVPVGSLDTDPKIHTCYSCHTGETAAPFDRRPVASVTYPSGFTATTGGEALLCQNCHQGLTWKGTVDTAIGQTGADFNASELNSHYLLAGALLYAGQAHGGYEYDGKTYNPGNILHQELNCILCHLTTTPGAPEVGGHIMTMVSGTRQNRQKCLDCHATITDFRTFQIFNSDYDGDGLVKGVAEEIDGLMAELLAQIQARGLTSVPSYPYWVPATGGPWDGPDGVKLKKAAYNYLFVAHDPGAYAHGTRYAIELLRDSYEDLTGTTLPGVRP